jgi:hypothetical protein
MSNERTDRRYGYSYVEQILLTISFGLRRQQWQIDEYTSGTVPEAMVFLPSDMPIDRVKEVQDWFDTILSGNLQERRKLRFLPGYGTGDSVKSNVIFPKEPLLKDELDVWLAQVVCACLGISAQPFLKMMNRASAEEANDAAQQEGTADDCAFVVDVLNTALDAMGFGDEYEWATQQHRDVDPLKQAQADNLLIGKAMPINEIREARGLDARPEPEANQLGMFTPQGFVPLGQTAQPAPPNGKPPAGKPASSDQAVPADNAESDDKSGDDAKDGQASSSKKKSLKSSPVLMHQRY